MSVGSDSRAEAPLLEPQVPSDPTPSVGLTTEAFETEPDWLPWAHTAWWKFTGYDGTAYLDLSGSTGGDLWVAVYQHVAGTFVLLPEEADYGSIFVEVQAGYDYYVQVGQEAGFTSAESYVVELTPEYDLYAAAEGVAVVYLGDGGIVGGAGALATSDGDTAYVLTGIGATGNTPRFSATLSAIPLPDTATILSLTVMVEGRHAGGGLSPYRHQPWIVLNPSDFVFSELDPDAVVDVTTGTKQQRNSTTPGVYERIFLNWSGTPLATLLDAATLRAGGQPIYLAPRLLDAGTEASDVRYTYLAVRVRYSGPPPDVTEPPVLLELPYGQVFPRLDGRGAGPAGQVFPAHDSHQSPGVTRGIY